MKQLAVEKENVNSEEIKVRTLSPISTYSTLYRKDGKKFTYYFNPMEEEFSETIENNLKKISIGLFIQRKLLREK